MKRSLILCPLLLLGACSDNTPSGSVTTPQSAETVAPVASTADASDSDYNEDRNAYFGDLHVHTMYSYDAFLSGKTSSPDDAYEFAKGSAVDHPTGMKVKLDVPLDFYAVTDHAYYLGIPREMAREGSELSRHELAQNMVSRAFRDFSHSDRRMEIADMNVMKTAWSDIIATANRHNDPGKFTAFIAYEYTSSGVDNENLHRNVIFRGSEAPEIPFSKMDSTNPEDLWRWMDGVRAAGLENLSIAHNTNGSNGWAFKLTDYAGKPLDDAYANLRMRNEPLVEISQIKGTSDTHPALSPNDEWADFEIRSVRIGTNDQFSQAQGSYVREALLTGITLQVNQQFNPYKFGLISASDTHAESGEMRSPLNTDTPATAGEFITIPYYNKGSVAGLAGVWAEENTREAIYDAFRRKETFATTGPRMKVRFFAGDDLPSIDDRDLISKAYENGVPMGGDLFSNADQEPSFLVWVAKDANSAPLQRVQVIKGWVENGEAREAVYDVACSDGGVVDATSNRCPDNGAQVNLADCSISSGVGAAELKAIWRDPGFDASQHAVYYVRALENPSCRWTTWRAIQLGEEPPTVGAPNRIPYDIPATIQERVWSSPIWITPPE